MGCGTCGSGGCSPAGCGDNGHCATGSCNKRNTYDWLSSLDLGDSVSSNLVEISFKAGARKDFYENDTNINFDKGDLVAVESKNGYDVGQISLSGELVKAQMKKKRFRQGSVLPKVLRRAHTKDIERLKEARSREKETLIRGRAIIKTLDMDMKLGEVEYQGDQRKCTFYYTAEGRVDFRELVRVLAKEFKVKIEMRQIGARQESAMIGGLGSCGRELCCSTWLSDFKSVSTAAARFQNLAINQAKLSGQCGRLKCCLNYELDTYLDALKDFPKKADYLHSEEGKSVLIKTDIFKRILYYSIPSARGRNQIVAVPLERVKEVIEMNKAGEKPDKIVDKHLLLAEAKSEEIEFADVTGEIDLPAEKRRKRNNRRRKGKRSGGKGQGNVQNRGQGQGSGKQSRGRKPKSGQAKSGGAPNDGDKKTQEGNKQSRGKSNNRRRNNKRRSGPKGPRPPKNNNDQKSKE